MEEEESLQEFLKQDDESSEIWSMALQLEVYLVTAARWWCGYTPTEITDFSPIYCDDTGLSVVTQLIKMMLKKGY